MDDPRPPDIEEILAELHEDARGRLKEELLPGERFLWAGRSHQDPFRWFGYLLAGILLLVFTISSFTSISMGFGRDRIRHDSSDGLLIAGTVTAIAAVITAISIAASLKGAIERRWIRTQHLYAVTDRRLIMRSPTFDRSGIEIRTIDLGLIGRIHRVEYPDGLGAVSFRAELGSGIADIAHGGGDSISTFKLERIAEVRRVELLLRQAVTDAKAGAAA